METNVIIHIYNEQYLLPFWLEHHSKIFDHGVIIDYRSTDASLEICKRICPTWTIITTRNEYFDSRYIDAEVIDIENGLTGIKISLNVTEFLFLNKPIKDIFKEYQDTNACFAINSNTPYSNIDSNPINLQDLIQMLSNDHIKYLKNNRPGDTGFRYIHNYSNGRYSIGRHSTGHHTILTEDLQIVWLGYFPWNQHMIKRKMQIKHNISEYDKNIGAGFQHLYSLETMEEKWREGYLHGKHLKENIHLYNILKMKPHFRAIILILASNFEDNKMYREVWKHYMFRDPAFKVMFIYGKTDNKLADYHEDYDIISKNIPEGLGISKVLEAFKIIEERFTYDYLVRTNLSTFWDFKKLHKHLDILPKQNCYSGDGPLPTYNKYGYYLSGVDTIVTPEMITSINNNNDDVDIRRNCEDEAMGLYFNGVLKAPMLPTRICFFEDIINTNQIDKIHNRIDDAIKGDITHYRVKNQNGNRQELDKCVYKELLNKIYGIILT